MTMRSSARYLGALAIAGLTAGCDNSTEPLTPATVVATSLTTQDAEVGTSAGAPPAVRVTSKSGDAVPDVSVTFAVTEGGGSLSGAAQMTDAAGVATAGAWTLGTTAGRNSVTATVGALPPVVFTATARAGPPASVAKRVGDNQSAVVGQPVTTPPSVLVKDRYENPVANASVVFTATAGGGSLSSPSQQTDAAGIATVGGWTLGTAAGSNILTATVDGVTPASFTATGTAAAAAALAAHAGDGQLGAVGQAVSIRPSVLVTDSYGNPVAGATVLFWIASGSGSIAGATQTSDAAGTATIGSWTLGRIAGPNRLHATLSGAPDVVFTATARAGPVNSVKVSPDGARIEIGNTTQLIADLRDAFGNQARERVVTWQSSNPAVATVSADGVVTGAVNGSVTVTATSEGKTGTASLQVWGVNVSLVNGDFESGDPMFGWTTGGTQNYAISRVQSGTGNAALVSVGDGPIGDASCTQPFYANFAYLDQRFNTVKDRVVELDILVPVPSTEDPTENATCSGFDRIEIDFVIEGTTVLETRALGVVLIDYFPLAPTAKYQGLINVHDKVAGTVSAAGFDPTAFVPVTQGALTLTQAATPGWLHATFDLSTSRFSWLPDNVVFRVTVRNEDNRRTGRHFAATVDNVRVRPK
jgi:hypothetical protein